MEDQRSFYLLFALGLVKQCPAGNRLKTCQVYKLANCCTLRDSYRFLNAMKDAALIEILAKHDACFALNQDRMILPKKCVSIE